MDYSTCLFKDLILPIICRIQILKPSHNLSFYILFSVTPSPYDNDILYGRPFTAIFRRLARIHYCTRVATVHHPKTTVRQRSLRSFSLAPLHVDVAHLRRISKRNVHCNSKTRKVHMFSNSKLHSYSAAAAEVHKLKGFATKAKMMKRGPTDLTALRSRKGAEQATRFLCSKMPQEGE